MIKTVILQNSRFFVLVLLCLMVGAAFYFFRPVILPFAVAAFLAYLIAPVIDRIAAVRVGRRHVHRGIAILLVYAIAVGVMSLGGAYFVPKLTSEVNRLVRELPTILRNVERNWIDPLDARVNTWLAEFVPLPHPEPTEEEAPRIGGDGHTKGQLPEPPGDGALVKLVEDYTYVVRRLDENRFEIVPRRRQASKPGEASKTWDFSRQLSAAFSQFRDHFENNLVELLQLSRRYVQAVVGSLFTTFLVLMTSAFILLDPQRGYRFICSMAPPHHRDKVEQFIARLDRGLAGVVRGQVLICLINGSMTGIGIAIIGVPFVITLTLIATLFSLIPIFGVLISTIPIILLALTVSFTTAVLALGWILIVHFFEGNILNPKIMGDSSHIHPVLIIFALVAGQYMGGILGALVAVPIFSLLQNSFLFLKGLAEDMETAT